MRPLCLRVPLALVLSFLSGAFAAPGIQTALAEEGGKIAPALQPFVDSHALAGAVVAVADRQRVLDLEAVGYADVAGNKPMQTDCLFWIASMSKPITATAVMMLVDEGKIALDDPVEKYLPEFAGQRVAVSREGSAPVLENPVHPITVRNVLSHTSGLPFCSPAEQPTLDGLPLAEAVRSYAAGPLNFQPDSRYAYSNAGINTAARILEVVSGMPYEEFMQKRLFEPLGMSDTTFWPSDAQVARLAKPYKPNAAKDDLEETTISQLRYPLTDRKKRFPMPAGGLFSTANDVARFCQMILQGGEFDGRRYVSAEAIAEMTRKQTAPALPDGYGLGWATGGDSFGHGGALATNMTIHARRGIITVYLVQHAGFPKDGGAAHEAFVRSVLERY